MGTTQSEFSPPEGTKINFMASLIYARKFGDKRSVNLTGSDKGYMVKVDKGYMIINKQWGP
jgi:hypothetical protein